MKKIAIIIAILLIIGIGIYYAVNSRLGGTSIYNSSPATGSPAISTTTPVAQTAQSAPEAASSATNTPAAPAQPSVNVSIKDFAFSPSALIIKTGTKVTWLNNDVVSHTITSDSGNTLKSAILSPGQSFSFTFMSPGTESYHCSIHIMMKGKVIVTN